MLLRVTFIFTLGVLLLGTAPVTAQSNCPPLLDAMKKIFSTPTHLYMTLTTGSSDGAKPKTAESIYTPDTIYVMLNGKWSRSTMTPRDMAELQQKNLQRGTMSCQHLRDELVDGQPAAVYNTHAENPDSKSDGQIWVSKTKGLLLRQEIDINTNPQGKPAKMHQSVRYEYKNVQAPSL
jgi:hypothetical protein